MNTPPSFIDHIRASSGTHRPNRRRPVRLTITIPREDRVSTFLTVSGIALGIIILLTLLAFLSLP